MTEEARENAESELQSFAQRIERLRDEKKVANAELNDAIKDVWAEAKGRGYDKKALDAVLKLRAMDEDTLAMIGVYADRLGVFA